MNTEQQLIIYRLAQENDLPVEKFLNKLQEVFHVDTSEYPKDSEGNIIYPDGRVGLELDIPLHEELRLYEAANLEGISANEFVTRAVEAAIENEKEKNPELFKD